MSETPAPETSEPTLVEPLARIWTRVKDHKVIQWTLAYLAAALALAHGAELVSQGFEWPHTVFRVVIALLALGLPIAVTLAWYHGHKGARRVSGAEAAIISLLMVICAVLLVVFIRPSTEHLAKPAAAVTKAAPATPASAPNLAPASTKPRIAILPFDNLSPDPDNAFFTDGMQEEILTALANSARGLEVISRTTMMSYKGKQVTVEQVAKDLACSHVLEGSVRREGDHVRLTLQLIDANTDEHLWAQNYDRKLVSAMTLQSEVAQEVASQLAVQLTPAAQAVARTTKDPVAYDFYLKARLARQTLVGYSRIEDWHAVEKLLTEAIARDSKFALAHVARFDVYIWMFLANLDPTPAVLERARADLEAARRLAPDDPAVLGAGAEMALADQDWAAAGDLYAKAEAAGLADPNLLIWKSNFLSLIGRYDEALATLESRLASDPANVSLLIILETAYAAAHRPADALRVIDLARASAPNDLALRVLRESYVIFGYTGKSEWIDTNLDEDLRDPTLGAAVDPTSFLLSNLGILQFRSRFAEMKALADAAPFSFGRVAVNPNLLVPGVPAQPISLIRGRIDLFLGDRRAAANEGDAVLTYAAQQPETKWSKWYLRWLSAEGHLFKGDDTTAIKLAHEALAAAPHGPEITHVSWADYSIAETLAWAGAKDEATALLERLTSESPGIAPAYAVRDPRFDIPLADNARYQALKAKLEAQMAATKLE